MYYNENFNLKIPEKLCVNLPYPELVNINPNFDISKFILNLYSGSISELSATMQFSYSSFCFAESNPIVYQLFRGVAMCEMKHLFMLSQLCIKLGTDPAYKSFLGSRAVWWSTSPTNINYSTNITTVLLNSIQGEQSIINTYTSTMSEINNDKINLFLRRIVMDHELHLEKFTETYNLLCR